MHEFYILWNQVIGWILILVSPSRLGEIPKCAGNPSQVFVIEWFLWLLWSHGETQRHIKKVEPSRAVLPLPAAGTDLSAMTAMLLTLKTMEAALNCVKAPAMLAS